MLIHSLVLQEWNTSEIKQIPLLYAHGFSRKGGSHTSDVNPPELSEEGENSVQWTGRGSPAAHRLQSKLLSQVIPDKAHTSFGGSHIGYADRLNFSLYGLKMGLFV